jgi:CBS domain-containing protein
MGVTARDIMETKVVTVSPDLPLLDAHRLFSEREIHGAPVVSDDGAVLGVISSADLLRAVTEEHSTGRIDSYYLREFVEFSGPDWANIPEDFQDRLREVRVSDVMTSEVVWVAPDASVSEVARTLCGQCVHRVLVMQGERLAGLISTFDLVMLLRDEPERAASLQVRAAS